MYSFDDPGQSPLFAKYMHRRSRTLSHDRPFSIFSLSADAARTHSAQQQSGPGRGSPPRIFGRADVGSRRWSGSAAAERVRAVHNYNHNQEGNGDAVSLSPERPSAIDWLCRFPCGLRSVLSISRSDY